ncbi:YrbL family protein [Bordetella bronchialis]|uniref:YrbL family protein n=1 Tax=Bordetella bronchialis TaxID=463025 RepID=UPI003D0936EC
MSIVPFPARREPAAPAAQPAPPATGAYQPFRLLDLTGLRPIASGAERLVYQHPHDPSLLVKVVDFPAMAEHLSTRPLRRWRKDRQREGAYRNHVAELAEYTAAQNAAAGRWKVPMARILGLAQTSMGLGLLVEKITDGQGGLAPTVEQIVRDRGLDESLARELDYFFDTLADHHIILNDVSARNVVMGLNADGEPGLYLIDGFGSKQAVPLFAYSKLLNRRRILRKYQVLRAKLQARSIARLQARQPSNELDS